MTKYICKCGRVVAKSTNADNTGNRDTAGCEGCPYLLPWGPMVWDDQQKGYTQDVKGYECRMSPTLEYASTYHGCADDKCSLHIVSLDLDFLDEVQAWIYDNAAYTLRAGFSRGSIRGIEFSDKGRYSLSILCAPNKKGVAAKAALIEHFFGPDKHRLDMTMQQEKAHILAAIEASKARAQKKEDKALTYKDPATGWLYRVGPEPFQDSYWVYYMDPKSSAFWKRCPQNSLYAGNKTAEGEEEYLRLNAKRNGWVPVDDVPGENPTCSDAATAADEKTVADLETPDLASTMAAPVAKSSELQEVAAETALAGANGSTTFDYSGLDDQTVSDLHLAEREYSSGMKMAEMGLRRMADAVAIAHDALCGSCDKMSQLKHGNRGENTFGAWCESIGIHRKAAERLLQVSKLMDGSTPREQKVLEELSPTLLYATAKPSAPAELVQAVKDGDITTHKQYQEAMAMLKERDAKIQELLEMSEAADRRADEAQAWAKKTEREADLDRKERDDANAAAMRYKAECDRRAAEQHRVEGLLATRENQLQASQAEVARQKRIGMEMQEAVESRDERIRELEQSQTVVAGTADPKEIERRAQEIAKAQIAENDAKWAEITENQGRKLRELLANSGASQAVKTAAASVQTILDGLFQALSLEEDDVAGQAALEDLEALLFDWSDSIHNMLHPEDTLGYPPDDEEGNTDDET